MKRLSVLLLLAGCTKEPEGPVCGLHAASEPVLLQGKRDVMDLRFSAPNL